MHTRCTPTGGKKLLNGAGVKQSDKNVNKLSTQARIQDWAGDLTANRSTRKGCRQCLARNRALDRCDDGGTEERQRRGQNDDDQNDPLQLAEHAKEGQTTRQHLIRCRVALGCRQVRVLVRLVLQNVDV